MKCSCFVSLPLQIHYFLWQRLNLFLLTRMCFLTCQSEPLILLTFKKVFFSGMARHFESVKALANCFCEFAHASFVKWQGIWYEMPKDQFIDTSIPEKKCKLAFHKGQKHNQGNSFCISQSHVVSTFGG